MGCFNSKLAQSRSPQRSCNNTADNADVGAAHGPGSHSGSIAQQLKSILAEVNQVIGQIDHCPNDDRVNLQPIRESAIDLYNQIRIDVREAALHIHSADLFQQRLNDIRYHLNAFHAAGSDDSRYFDRSLSYPAELSSPTR